MKKKVQIEYYDGMNKIVANDMSSLKLSRDGLNIEQIKINLEYNYLINIIQDFDDFKYELGQEKSNQWEDLLNNIKDDYNSLYQKTAIKRRKFFIDDIDMVIMSKTKEYENYTDYTIALNFTENNEIILSEKIYGTNEPKEILEIFQKKDIPIIDDISLARVLYAQYNIGMQTDQEVSAILMKYLNENK
jgi:type III secretory pathway component EscU